MQLVYWRTAYVITTSSRLRSACHSLRDYQTTGVDVTTPPLNASTYVGGRIYSDARFVCRALSTTLSLPIKLLRFVVNK